MELKSKQKHQLIILTDENQIKIMKEHIEKSIERYQEEDKELGDESGNSVPKSLTNKEKWHCLKLS